MSKLQFAIVTVLLAAIGAIHAAPLLTKPSTKWEYSVKGLYDSTFAAELTRLGEEGWEIASARRAVDGGVGMYEVIFKRPSK